MKSRINRLLEEIEQKKIELKGEYLKLMEKYSFSFIKGKIVFTNEARIANKKKKKSILESIFSARVREILSMPFIYSMIIPAIILDIFLFMYQNTAIRLYGIPLVKRSDYISFERKELDYLNTIQKVNCLYCSYVNGLFSYAVEVGGRTEKYWCPIKSAKKMRGGHEWQKYFADYGDPEGFRECFLSIDEYYKEKEKSILEEK
ncbi:MAG: hypothetical protein PHH98_02205 [Candidatus Gracilibacteria bacterium]|nr:hypothetical protein [Candidatus Gracilibacteria bacterium]